MVNDKRKKKLKYKNKYGSGIGELINISPQEKKDIINKNNEQIEKKEMEREDTKRKNVKAILSPGDINSIYVDEHYGLKQSPMKTYRKAEKENFEKNNNIRKIEDTPYFETSDDESINQNIMELDKVLKVREIEIKKLKKIIYGMQKIVTKYKKQIYELHKENAKLKLSLRKDKK